MLVKFMENILNTDEIKYITFDRYGYSSSKYNGAYQPLIVIKFIDNEVLKIKIEDEDIEEYRKLENIILNQVK